MHSGGLGFCFVCFVALGFSLLTVGPLSEMAPNNTIVCVFANKQPVRSWRLPWQLKRTSDTSCHGLTCLEVRLNASVKMVIVSPAWKLVLELRSKSAEVIKVVKNYFDSG